MPPRIRRLPAILLLLALPLAAEIRSLTILHVNDLHARLTPLENHAGGFAYLAGAIRHERANCHDCILLNAGDLVQGTPVSTIFRGTPVFQIGNLLGFDVSMLGNHEFDYGWEQAESFLKIANYPMVDANVVDGAGKLMTKPYTILKVNGLRVAVIGIMTDTLADVTAPKTMGDWHSIPAIATARKYAAELKGQSDLIVMLGHIAPAEEQKFLADAPEIPVLVTGHAHNGMSEVATQGGRIQVRVKGYGQELGRLELRVDTEKKAPVEWHWKRIAIDSTTMEPAADVAEQVRHWEGEVTAVVDKPLAVSTKEFNKREVKALIERALREETGSDFAWMNMGGVRDTLPKGQLLLRHIWDIMPFDNTVQIGKFKGSQLPAVVVGDRKVDPNREYTLAVSDFTAANQQTQENLRTTGLQFPKDAGVLRDVLIAWFEQKKVIGDEPAGDASAKLLPDGPGKAAVGKVCTACHNTDSIRKQRLAREQWSDKMDDMVDRGAKGTDDELMAVLDYLTQNFGKDSKMYVNTAPYGELKSVLGLTNEETEAILAYRKQNGNFQQWRDLLKVAGLDPKKIEAKKDLLVF